MLQYPKKAIHLVSKILICTVIFFGGCDRDTPVETTDDGRPPSKPQGLSIFREYDGEIGIEWNQNLEKDIAYYRLFRSNSVSAEYIQVDSTSSSFFIDTQLAYDTTYYYKISAVDIVGNISEFSDSVSGTPANLYTPFPPYYLTINARNWNDSLSMKITFGESFSTDVDYYEIHRSTDMSFTPNSTTIIGSNKKTNYIDKSELNLLQEYFYKIISVDKGNLKSKSSVELTDILLDKPKLVFPNNNTVQDYFAEFKIKTCSLPTSYKIVLQSNEIYGPEVELNFFSQKTNTIISVPIKNVTFTAYADYYWRVFTYTKNNNIPNSYSELYKFTIVPGN